MDSYISIYNNAFGLFQYYFWELMLNIPYVFVVLGFIALFYLLIKRK